MIWPSPPRNSPGPPESWRYSLRHTRIGETASLTSIGTFFTPLGKAVADRPSAPGRAPVPPAWKLMTLKGMAFTVSAGSPSVRPGPPRAKQVPQARRALGRHAAAQRLVQAAEHHVGQHLAGDVAGRDRRGMLGVEDAALGRGDADHRQRALVVRHLGRHDAFDAKRGIGLGVADRHVDAVGRHARGAGEVDVDAALADLSSSPRGRSACRSRRPSWRTCTRPA